MILADSCATIISTVLPISFTKKPYTFFILAIIISSLFLSGCRPQNTKEKDTRIVKIGTIHRVKSKNLLFDPSLSLFSIISHPPLLKLGEDGNPVGLLAKNYHYSADYTTWTFQINQDYYWSDGHPVSPEDIKFTLLYKNTHLPFRKWLGTIIRKIDISGNQVTCTLNQPYTHFDIELASIRIFPRHIWQGIEDPRDRESGKYYTGCGPYIIREADLNSGIIRFCRNPYWKGANPRINQIEIHTYHNVDVLSLALKRGDVDTYYKYADTFPYENINSLKASGHFKILTFKQSGLVFLGFNLKKSPFSDSSLRLAVLYALDYAEIIRLIARGYGALPRRGFIPSHFRFYHPTESLHRNIGLAKTLLEDAGYKDVNGDGFVEDPGGNQLKINLVSTSIYIRLGELIIDYLKQIGLRTRLQILDPASWVNMKDNYQYDLTLSRTTPWGMMMHAGWATGYFDSRRSGEGVLHTLDDPDFIGLCDDILATKIPGQLKSLARKIQEYYARHLPAIALIWKTDVIPMKHHLSGWHHDPLFGIYNINSLLNLQFNDAQL